MRFRYIDVQMMRIVGVFENSHGKIHYWTERKIIKNQRKFKEIGDWDAAVECQDALEMMRDYKTVRKPWWKFW
jgi:hypothetical protein